MKFKDFAYGRRPDEQVALPKVQLPLAVHEFRRSLFRAYCWFLSYAVLTALLLPHGARELNATMSAWVDFVQQYIPYVAWVEKNSNVPSLASAWFSLVWPLIPIYLILLVFRFPYRSAQAMARARPMSIVGRLSLVGLSIVVSGMTYFVFFERRFAVLKATTVGHARLLEAAAIDSRAGLIVLGPVLATICLLIWSGTTLLILMLLERFYPVDTETKRG